MTKGMTTNESPSLPLDPAKTVVKELRMLAESHPNHNNGKTARAIEVQTFLRGDVTLTHRTVGDTLPLPTDAPAYYYVLGVLGRARAKDASIRTIVVKIRDVVDGTGLKRGGTSYESVDAALCRYSRLNVAIKYPDKVDPTEFRLFGVSPVGVAALRLDFSQDYLDALESGKNQVHYFALHHILPLGGLATSLYALMQTHLYHSNKLNVGARRFCRTWLGEERGSEIAVSRAFSAYVRPRLQEIADKTGWAIVAEKIGRADDARYMFKTDAVPQAFSVIDTGETAATSALDEMADKSNTGQAAHIPFQETEVISDPILPAAVLSALPPEASSNRAVTAALASLSETDALVVTEYVRKNAKKGFAAYLNGILKVRTIKSLVAEIRAKKSDEIPPEATHFHRIYRYKKQETEGELRKYAAGEGLDADEMLRWFDAWKAQGR